jgi:hypothetical protein
MPKFNYILGMDFYYSGINVDYNFKYSCRQSGCDQEGICRCGEIVDQEITDVDLLHIVEKVYDNFFDDDEKTRKRDEKINEVLFGTGKDFDYYTIDRILRSSKIWEKHLWDINICSGYYGQEIDKVELTQSVASKLENQIYEALSINSFTERMEYLLMLEYGKILPELEDCIYEIIKVKKEDLILGSDSNVKAVKDEMTINGLKHYKHYTGIKGIVIPKGDKFRVIDGYHRIFVNNNNYPKVIVAKKLYDE